MPGIYKKQPDARFPRFNEPAEPCPVSSFSGYVRQISRAGVSPGERALIDAAFGGFVANFLPGGEVMESLKRFDPHQENLQVGLSKTPRRFAGDDSLPGGRYATLCTGPDGDDGGTLIGELRFYTDSAAANAYIIAYDPVIPAHRDLLTQKRLGLGVGGNHIYLNVIPFDQGGSREVPFGFFTGFDVEVRQVTTDGVLDLRRPDAANWLARTISSLRIDLGDGQSLRCFPHRPDLDSFPGLLPAIADQAKGGGNLHLITGLYLRQLGVAALVFPSARTDFSVYCSDGAPVQWRGWTLVDYRDAPVPTLSVFFELRSDWPSELVLEGGDDGGRHRAAYTDAVEFLATPQLAARDAGFAVRGIEQRLRAVFVTNAVDALLRDRFRGDRAGLVRPVLEFFAALSSRDAAGLGEMVLFATLGMRTAQHDLLALLDGPLGSASIAPTLRECCASALQRSDDMGHAFFMKWFGGVQPS